jgi:predicted nucleic acid-binding protein
MSRKQQRATDDVTLTDTGPIVALFDEADQLHAQAQEALIRLPKKPLITTWPCFTEAMYLLYQAIGYTAQEELWGWVADGLLQLYLPGESEWPRMRVLMAQYKDAPMDMADASVVVAAEALDLTRVFTYDRHFYAYRLANGNVLEVVA